MLRRNIAKQLREVSSAAEEIASIQIENKDTGETIDIDAAFAKCLIQATLAYAASLVVSLLKRQDPDCAIRAIIQTATTVYVEGK